MAARRKLTEGLLASLRSHPNVTLAGGHTLLGLRPVGLGQATLELDRAHQERHAPRCRPQRLILALPRLPLVKLAPHLPDHIAGQLDSVNGFPMLKIFFVSNAPWWDYDQPPQQYANCLPTREVHYFRRPQDADHDGHGMVLLYMDRPSTEFWRHYVIDAGATRPRRSRPERPHRRCLRPVRRARREALAGVQRRAAR